MSVRLLVTGARDWSDETVIRDALLDWSETHGFDFTLVHGACPTGADAIADQWASDYSVKVERHYAAWDLYGKAAGPIRNQAMVDLGADVCFAFVGARSKGTLHCLAAARRAGIPVRVWHAWDDDEEGTA